MSGGHWNRAGRRSGGDRRAVIPVGVVKIALPLVSMPCFERRHADCSGDLTMAPGECECDCHAPTPQTKKGG